MKLYVSKFGDWTKAGIVMQALSVSLTPAFRAQLNEDGELLLKNLVSHIDRQDLPWAPLSESTIAKKGHSTVYYEEGYLRDNLEVRKVKAPANGLTLFVGASPWKRTKSGVKFSDLMIWLEYGTYRIPPRPLIRPTWEETYPVIQENWQALLKNLIDSGGSYHDK